MADDKQNTKDLYSNLKSIKMEKQKELALYVHIPFCEKKCAYCNFVSFCGCSDKIDEYIDALIKEIELRLEHNVVLKTIYFGGGTPSILSESQIEKLFTAIKNSYEISEDAEITIEVNPNSVTKEKLIKYKELGINRVSIGVQSLNDKKLKMLGRLHTSKEAINALKEINECGFDNISGDLIINLPNQSTFEIKSHIRKIKRFVKHISIYSLSVEEGTPLFDMCESGKVKLQDEIKSAKQLESVAKYLQKIGFLRYEVSNFAIKNFESKHNNTYWQMGEYLGVGVAAHSFMGGIRYANTEELDLYISSLKENKLPYANEVVSKENLLEETIMLALRMASGLDLQMLKEKFNVDLLNTKKNEIMMLKNLKLIEVVDNKIRVTNKGYLLLNQITIKLI